MKLTVTVPYRCTGDANCPGRVVHHDCADLAVLEAAANEIEPAYDHPVHAATVVLLTLGQFNPKRKDLAAAVAVQTGRSFYFVRRCIKKLRANGLLTDPFPPSDWLDEKLGVATLITDALVAIGVFKRVDNAGGEFRFRVVNASRIDEVVPDGTHVLVFEPAKKRGRPSTRPATLAGAPAGSGPATYAKLVEMNLCAKCGRASRVDGRSRCAPCQQYAREHMKRKTVEG